MIEGGLPDADASARIILAQLDGILFDALTRPFFGATDRPHLRHAINACLTGLGI